MLGLQTRHNVTDCWNKGWFCCTYEKTVDILINAIDGGYEIEKLM